MTHLAHLLAQLNIVACSTTLAIPEGKADVALADNLHISHRPGLTAKSSPIGLKEYHLQSILAGILLGQTIGPTSSSRNDGLNGVKLLVGEFTLNKFAHQIIVLKCATTYHCNFHSLLFLVCIAKVRQHYAKAQHSIFFYNYAEDWHYLKLLLFLILPRRCVKTKFIMI